MNKSAFVLAFTLLAGCLWLFSGVQASAAALSDKDFITLCEEGTPEEIRQALAAGANVNALSRYNGIDVIRGFGDATTLMHAAMRNKNPKVVQLLLDAGVDVNAQDKAGMTALLWAVMGNENIEVARTLLAAGAEVNAKTKAGGTALILAANLGNLEQVQMLIAAGADVNAKNRVGQTALIVGAGRPGLAQALLAAGADVNAKDRLGRTALMWAAFFENIEAVQAILAAGADVRAKDNEGETALMMAEKRGRTKVVELLRKAAQ